MSRVQRRTTILATALIVLGLLLALLPKDWIEDTINVDPDAGSGALELGLVLAPIAVGLVLLVAVFIRHRREVKRASQP